MTLKDIPDGVTCYVDATIFYYHIVNTLPLSDDCSDFLERVDRGNLADERGGPTLFRSPT